MTCCRCNRSGSCRNCSCVKNGQNCTNCLPGRLDKCTNSTSDGSIAEASVQSGPRDSDNSQADVESPQLFTEEDLCESFPINATQQQETHVYAEHSDTQAGKTDWNLPEPTPVSSPSFSWGLLDAESFINTISQAYDEVVRWRKNLFLVPFGKAGNQFVTELARLFRAVADGSSLECIALKASTVLTILALQKPYRKSKAKLHAVCLERRLNDWLDGRIEDLLAEGRTIQKRNFRGLPFTKRQKSVSASDAARDFASLMFQGKCGAALRKLSGENSGGVLGEDDVLPSGESVSCVLKNKHPDAQGLIKEALSPPEEEPPLPNSVIFDCIDADLIRQAAKNTSGAAGPSGMDAHGWRRLCCTFKSASSELCHSLALLARRVCIQYIHPSILAPLCACRLVALNKCPGVRPVGICEVARRIISKAILFVVKDDIREAAGSHQLCGGQIAGIEAAVHAVRQLFDNDDTEAILLVDASNAFNSLNRANALTHIRGLCPPLSTVLTNFYRESAELYLGKDTLLSREGTTQGDPLAMPFYALATRPLIEALSSETSNLKQIWYADDATAAGKISSLKKWWDKLSSIGPSYGYFVNLAKSWLVTKDDHLLTASDLFGDTNVNITSEGRSVLGSPIGKPSFIESFVNEKVQEWTNDIENLSMFADSQPHAAYSALTHGLTSKWNYLSRTTPDIDHLLQPLEDSIRSKLFPKLTGRDPPSDQERMLFALPARLGGLNIWNPVTFANDQYCASKEVSKPLVDQILSQTGEYTYEVLADQITAKNEVKTRRRQQGEQAADQIRETLSPSMQYAMDLSKEKGASNWLTVLPLEEHGFSLHKRAFRDAIALRYGWLPTNTPSNCSCGHSFTIQHALSCPKGGYPSIRHNELRDLTASLLTETCHDVAVEPSLQPVTTERLIGASANTQDGARSDIVASGFWGGTFERAFFDVRVFNPFAPSNRRPNATATYRQHESVR